MAVDVGPSSGVTDSQRQALLDRGFRGDPTDRAERLYGSADTGELDFLHLPASAVHPVRE